MFSTTEKIAISKEVEKILRATRNPELPEHAEIRFLLHVDGKEWWSWANIRNLSEALRPCNDELKKNTSVPHSPNNVVNDSE